MDTHQREELADLLRPVVAEARLTSSTRELARQMGISYSWIAGFLRGEHRRPSARSLAKILHWARVQQRALPEQVAGLVGPAYAPRDTTAAQSASRADAFIAQYESEAGRRLMARIGPTQALLALYEIALDEGWPEREIQKVDAYREEVRRGGTAGAEMGGHRDG